MPLPVLAATLLAAALLSAALIVALKPFLLRYALARPNARSSHKAPTPQGGGIAVVAAALAAAVAAGPLPPALVAAALGLAALGAVDDIRPLPALPRLALQVLAVAAVASAADLRVLPEVPAWLERALVILAGTWFVNLVNFMDGLDWITVAEMVPITGFVAGLGVLGLVPAPAALVAAGLCGALLGFAPFNRPVARLFLGDVGSLPIGLLVAWMLYRLALDGGLAAALLLPLYYLADATITLLRRLMRGERVWEAHRTHFYQQATDRGLPVVRIAAHVLTVNVALAGLAGATLAWRSLPAQLAALALGGILVALVLARFAAPGGRRLPA
jgi:UDP-N-acetylmuramyl pentapeptide phosphotransferase/UDP-N-acetylglucosamine-1-phosphate transferase